MKINVCHGARGIKIPIPRLNFATLLPLCWHFICFRLWQRECAISKVCIVLMIGEMLYFQQFGKQLWSVYTRNKRRYTNIYSVWCEIRLMQVMAILPRLLCVGRSCGFSFRYLQISYKGIVVDFISTPPQDLCLFKGLSCCYFIKFSILFQFAKTS